MDVCGFFYFGPEITPIEWFSAFFDPQGGRMNRRLRLRILEQFGSQTNFAQAVGTVFTLPFPVRGHHHSQKISLKPKSGGSGRPLSGLKPPSTLFAVLLRGTAHEVKEKFSSEKAISPNPSAKAHSVPIRGLTKDSSVAFEPPMTSRQDSAF